MSVHYAFTVTEHDLDMPCRIVDRTHHAVNLSDGKDFFAWAVAQWPTGRFTVELDPWSPSEGSMP